MKITLDKIPGFNKLPPVLRNNPKLAFTIIFSLIIALTLLLFAGSKETRKIQKSLGLVETKKTASLAEDKDVGVITGSVDTKSYVNRIEKQYYDISSKFDSLNERIAVLEKSSQDLRKNQTQVSRIVIDLDKRVTDKLEQNTGLTKKNLERGQSTGSLEETLLNPLSMSQPAGKTTNLEMLKSAKSRLRKKFPGRGTFIFLWAALSNALFLPVCMPLPMKVTPCQY